MVQVGRPPEEALDLSYFLDFLRDVRVEIVEGAQEHLDLMRDEIGQVVPVSLGVQERPGIPGRGLLEETADRDELAHPVPVTEHRPVEERPSRAPVAIFERVVVGEPEVKRDGADDRVQKRTVSRVLVGEPDQRVHPIRQLFRWRRGMENAVLRGIPHPDAFFSRGLHTPGGVRVVERVGRHGDIQTLQRIESQRSVLHVPDRLHRPIVVEDHPFATVARPPAGPDHRSRDRPGRRCPFELT